MKTKRYYEFHEYSNEYAKKNEAELLQEISEIRYDIDPEQSAKFQFNLTQKIGLFLIFILISLCIMNAFNNVLLWTSIFLAFGTFVVTVQTADTVYLLICVLNPIF